jgi:hypothetical protein
LLSEARDEPAQDAGFFFTPETVRYILAEGYAIVWRREIAGCPAAYEGDENRF